MITLKNFPTHPTDADCAYLEAWFALSKVLNEIDQCSEHLELLKARKKQLLFKLAMAESKCTKESEAANAQR